MKGIALMLGKPEPAKSASSEEVLAREAFSALKDDDEEGFAKAFVAAVKACVGKAKSDSYEAEEDDEE